MRPEEEQHVAAVREVCQEVYTVPMHRSRVKDVGYWLRSNLTGRPFLIERDDLLEMRSVVEQILTRDNIDIIHADQLTMAQFGLKGKSGQETATRENRNGAPPNRIFDAHNAVWTIVERMKAARSSINSSPDLNK